MVVQAQKQILNLINARQEDEHRRQVGLGAVLVTILLFVNVFEGVYEFDHEMEHFWCNHWVGFWG